MILNLGTAIDFFIHDHHNCANDDTCPWCKEQTDKIKALINQATQEDHDALYSTPKFTTVM